MPDLLNAEAVFLEHLGTIDRAAAKAARRYGLWGQDAEDFIAWVRLKLMEQDYVAFHKFRGEADWKTYLTMVVLRLASGYSREQRGRWRPSAAAERHGPPAPQLEMLVHRDGLTVPQAGETLRTAGATALTDLELARLLATLPERQPMRPVEVPSESVLEGAPGPSRADAGADGWEDDASRDGLMATLRRVMEGMPREDALIVRWHFEEGRSVADVARALGLDQKAQYRRVPRLRDTLRAALERAGVSASEVRELLDREEP
ncbi:MAG TPA: sigma-70 family RNA polymerase sigma factor [Longimicrobium sp.]|nr:sigma-70 family RNA polymerase sigma factor [Longimicrobium sp.]